MLSCDIASTGCLKGVGRSWFLYETSMAFATMSDVLASGGASTAGRTAADESSAFDCCSVDVLIGSVRVAALSEPVVALLGVGLFTSVRP